MQKTGLMLMAALLLLTMAGCAPLGRRRGRRTGQGRRRSVL